MAHFPAARRGHGESGRPIRSWGSWAGPVSIREDGKRTNIDWTLDSVSGSIHVVICLYKNGCFIPILQIKAAEAQKLRSLRRVSHPPQGRSWGWSTFLSPKLLSLLSHPRWIYSRVGLGDKTSHGTAGVTWQSHGLGVFMWPGTFSLTVLHSTAEGTCELASWAPPESCVSVRPRVCGCFLVLRETCLKKVLGSSRPAVGECLWNEWVCCLLETPVNRSGFTHSPSFLLGSFPTEFIWKQIPIIYIPGHFYTTTGNTRAVFVWRENTQLSRLPLGINAPFLF